MNTLSLKRALSAVSIFLTSFTLVSAQTWINDSFNSTLDAGVWVATSAGSGSATVSGGNLNISGVTTSNSHRALLLSQATDFNFFDAPITMTTTFTSLGGEGSATIPVNRYMLIGSPGSHATPPFANSRYYVGTELNTGVWLSAGNLNGANYLEVGNVRAGNVTTFRRNYTGDLSSMSLSLNGLSFSVSATGTGGFVLDGPAFSGTLDRITEAHFNSTVDSGASIFRFAIGASNGAGTVTSGAAAQFDSVVVIPEPGTLALVGIALAALVIGKRKQARRG